MREESRTIRVYTMPLEMPCGPAASCCGPIGQTEEEIEQLRWGLEHTVLGAWVEIINIRQKLNLQRDAAALTVLQAFGPMALPVLTVDGQIVSIGPPEVPELVAKLRATFASAASAKSS